MEPNKIIRKLKNEDGAALVLAMMVLLVLSVLGAMLGTLTVGSYRLSANNQDYNSAYYIAEAGANMAYEEIKSEVENLATDPYKQGSIFMAELEGLFEEVSLPEEAHFTYETNEEGEPYFQEQSGEIPKASVKVISESPHTREGGIFTKEYIIQSTGIVAGKEREVEKPFKVTWKEQKPKSSGGNSLGLPEGAAIIFKYKADFKNNTTIENGRIIGDEGATTVGKTGDHPELENLELEWESYQKALDSYLKNTEEMIVVNNPLSSSDWIINTTNGETINYKVNSLDFKNGSIVVKGGGTVNIFLDTPITNDDFSNNSEITSEVDGKLNIIYAGTASLTIGNGGSGEFVLFAPNAKINLDNSSVINGSIIAYEIELKNGSKIPFPGGLTYDFPFELEDNSDEESEPIELITSEYSIEQ